MTTREQVARYLTDRIHGAIATVNADQALHLTDFLKVVQDMSDDEFDDEPREIAA